MSDLLFENLFDVNIKPVQDDSSFSFNNYSKIPLSPNDQILINNFIQQITKMHTSSNLSNLYTVSFPDGLPHTLTKLNQGGYGSMIKDGNKIVGSASFHDASSQIALYNSMTAMAAISGQYYLSQINDEINMINLKIDKILEFLYGNKKAELLSEISFVRYAHQNYKSMIKYDQQRIATLSSLQSAKKVAMKDVEFYIADIQNTVNESYKSYETLLSIKEKAIRIKDSLSLSLQLFMTSSLLEIYYSLNTDPDYINFIESDISYYITKCNKFLHSSFNVLKRRFKDHSEKLLNRTNTTSVEKELDTVIEYYEGDECIKDLESIKTTLSLFATKTDFVVSTTGEFFIKEES